MLVTCGVVHASESGIQIGVTCGVVHASERGTYVRSQDVCNESFPVVSYNAYERGIQSRVRYAFAASCRTMHLPAALFTVRFKFPAKLHTRYSMTTLTANLKAHSSSIDSEKGPLFFTSTVTARRMVASCAQVHERAP